MNIDDRRRIEMDALREYHAIVCGMGAQNFTFEGCWRSYRQNMRGGRCRTQFPIGTGSCDGRAAILSFPGMA